MNPEDLLAVRWRSMEAEELARHLRRLLVAERKVISGEFARRIRPRLKWRRLAVAQKLVGIGGVIRPEVLARPHARVWSGNKFVANVPPRYSWLGVFSLVPLTGTSD